LLGVFQVKQCEQNKYKLQKYYLKEHSQEHQEYSNRTPRDHHKNTKRSSKASLLLLKRMVAIWQQDYKREMGREQERVRRNLGSMELLSNFMSK
jgi:hypothetical protein